LTGTVRGVWCALLTPLDRGGHVDAARMIAHARLLLGEGVDGLAPFGTTGAGKSFSVAERMAGLEALLAGGVPPERILAATACAALPDTIALTRHAVAAGCIGALVLPPFFFKGVGDDGVYASYAGLIDAVADPRLRLYLYHIPQVTAVPVSSTVIARLCRAYPGVIAGLRTAPAISNTVAQWPPGFANCAFSSATSPTCRRCSRRAARERSAASPISIHASCGDCSTPPARERRRRHWPRSQIS